MGKVSLVALKMEMQPFLDECRVMNPSMHVFVQYEGRARVAEVDRASTEELMNGLRKR